MMNECWLWSGCTYKGYGRAKVNGKVVGVHRAAYEQLVGPIPSSLVIDHLCRIRNCYNPRHLEPVTNLENTRRGVSGGKITGEKQRNKTHCKWGHPFNSVNTYNRIDRPGRECRPCRKMRNDEFRTSA